MNVTPLLVERMRAALDAHDLDAFLDFFHEDYIGERPRHPDSAPSTREDVRENWSEVIRDVPDLRIEIPAATQDGDTIWSEWRAYGTARSGAMLELRGVIIFGVRGKSRRVVAHVSRAARARRSAAAGVRRADTGTAVRVGVS
jgi:ketosteroid isomerase-like protein